MSFQKQPFVVAYSVCRCVSDSDGYFAAPAYVTDEGHAQGDGESLLTYKDIDQL